MFKNKIQVLNILKIRENKNFLLYFLLFLYLILDFNKSYAIICSYNAYNCSDFKTQCEAQKVLDYCGRYNDIHWLDDDKDGIACEWNPPCYNSTYYYTSCGIGSCLLNGGCYKKPLNAHCVSNDKYDAWKCDIGYTEKNNSCVLGNSNNFLLNISNSNKCLLNGIYYKKPLNAHCVDNDKYNAWKCNEGYYERYNKCFKIDYYSYSFKRLVQITCGKNSFAINSNECRCIKGYVWKNKYDENNLDCIDEWENFIKSR